MTEFIQNFSWLDLLVVAFIALSAAVVINTIWNVVKLVYFFMCIKRRKIEDDRI
jgi:hypothetical protein